MANVQPSPFNEIMRQITRTDLGPPPPRRDARDAIGQNSAIQPATAGEQALTTAIMLASLVAAPLAAYHGYKRNDSVGWAIAWGLLGGLFPVITIPVALAQGFGQPRSGL